MCRAFTNNLWVFIGSLRRSRPTVKEEVETQMNTRTGLLRATAARLERLREAVEHELRSDEPLVEVDSPHINAPAWPWLVAGGILGAMFVVLFILARLSA